MECLAIQVEPRQAAAGGDPQIPRSMIACVAILQYGDDPIARQAVALAIVRERACRCVEAVEPTASQPDPEQPGAVEVDVEDIVIGEAGRVLWVVLVARDQPGRRIQVIQPAAKCADPDAA